MQSACLKGAISGLTHRGKHAVSFNHLVGGGKELWRKSDAEGFCGLQIDHQLELGRRLHGKIARLVAPEDALDIAGRPAELVVVVSPVGHQPGTVDESAVP